MLEKQTTQHYHLYLIRNTKIRKNILKESLKQTTIHFSLLLILSFVIKTIKKTHFRSRDYALCVLVSSKSYILKMALKQTTLISSSTSFFTFFLKAFFTDSLSASRGPSGWPHRGTGPAGLGSRDDLQSLCQGLLCPCLPAGPHRGSTPVLCWPPSPP